MLLVLILAMGVAEIDSVRFVGLGNLSPRSDNAQVANKLKFDDAQVANKLMEEFTINHTAAFGVNVTMCVKSPDTWVVTKLLSDKGTQGRIFEVVKIKHLGKQPMPAFALKVAKAPKDVADIAKEAKVMTAAQACQDVLRAVDPAPCVSDYPHPGAVGSLTGMGYVMPKVAGDVVDFLMENGPIKEECQEDFQNTIIRGMHCLHKKAEYIQGDFHFGNVMYSGIENGCPSGIAIGDFGYAAQVNSHVPQEQSADYPFKTHFVAGRFSPAAGIVDTLGISKPPYFVAKTRIDWCMVLLSFRQIFGPKAKLPGFNADCGMMGENRALHLVS